MACHDSRNTAYDPDGDGPRSKPTERWRVESDGSAFSSPIVAGDTVFSGGQALTVADGSIRWQVASAGGSQGTSYIEGFKPPVPALLDGYLCLTDPGARKFHVVRASGAVSEWSMSINPVHTTSPVALDGSVFLGGYEIGAYDVQSGDPQWTTESRDMSVQVCVAADEELVVGTSYGGTVMGIECDTGEVRWEGSMPSYPHGPPILGADHVYVCSNHTIRAFDRQTGSQAWTVNHYFPHMALTESTLLVTGMGTLFGVSTASGTVEFNHSIEGGRPGPPTIAGDVAYVPVDESGIVAYDLADRTRLWRFDEPVVRSPPVVADGSLYVRSGKQELLRLE